MSIQRKEKIIIVGAIDCSKESEFKRLEEAYSEMKKELYDSDDTWIIKFQAQRLLVPETQEEDLLKEVPW